MRKIISIIEKLPVWYGLGVVFLYSLLLAEFFSTFLRLFPYEEVLNNIFTVILGVGYTASILSGFIVWIIYTLLFYLTAILFGGQSTFKQFLLVSAYPYLIPACILFVGVILLDKVSPLGLGHSEELLTQDSTFKLAMDLINYSLIPYYLIITVLIHYVHKIKYIYAFLSVAIPILSILDYNQFELTD